MKLVAIAVCGIILSCQIQKIFAQRFQFFRPTRVCEPHVPLPTNVSSDIIGCTREQNLALNVKDPDANNNIVQISQENGYTIYSYNVTTSDGYILTLFRISGGRNSPPRKGKPGVLVLHGWGNSCEAWIALPNDKNLVYMLVDAGWDVWLANFRGSSFSLLHKALNSNLDLKYWDFSFHEMGVFDFPSILDIARKESGLEKMFVIGHSQGATAFLVAASEVPSINEKIHAAYFMAPAVGLGSSDDPVLLALISITNTPGEDLLYHILQGRIQLRNPRLLFSALRIRPQDICHPLALRCGLCNLPTMTPRTFNPSQMNYTNIPRIVSKLFDYGTIKAALHFAQNTRSCSFRKYDRGTKYNLKYYGSKNPPSYNLKNLKIPIFVFWGEQDPSVTPSDIKRFVKALPSETIGAVVRVKDDTFNHLDFLVGRDANKLVYKPLLKMMTEFKKQVEATI